MVQVVQHAIDAISVGSIFALMALSLALLFGVMRLVNFAYGELIMAGGYTMVFLRDEPWPVMILGTLAVVVALGVAMERVAFRPVRNASFLTLLITSFAISFMLQRIAGMTVGTVPRGIRPWQELSTPIEVGGVFIARLDIITLATIAALLGGLTLLLRRTLLGIHLRASTEDFDMARLLGVRANRVIASAFAITGVLAAAVALLYFARFGSVSPTVGFGPVLIAFVGGVIGGLGSLVGAAVGGFFLGVTMASLQATLPVELAGYTQVFAFAAVIAVLVLRPGGLAVRSSTTVG